MRPQYLMMNVPVVLAKEYRNQRLKKSLMQKCLLRMKRLLKGIDRFGEKVAVSVEIGGGDFDSMGLDIVEVDDDIIGEVMKERQ